jgi:hypothetical protein
MPANDLSDLVAIDSPDQSTNPAAACDLAMPSGTRLRCVWQLPMAAGLPLTLSGSVSQG